MVAPSYNQSFFSISFCLHLLTTLANLLFFAVLPFSSGNAAEMGLTRQELAGTSPRITVAAIIVSGQIVSGDEAKIAGLLAELKRSDNRHQIKRLIIHSPGGLAGEAMQIGKLLRDNKVEIFLPQQVSCISACVLILAAGLPRSIEGHVGIDHPYFQQAAGPGDDVPALLAQIRQTMREYFQSMGVAGSLVDAMFALPNGQLHYLTQDELIKYHLK